MGFVNIRPRSLNKLLTTTEEDMETAFQSIEENFLRNIEDVYKLMEFDRIILDFSIKALEKQKNDLQKLHRISNPQLLAENTLTMIKNIRNNDSLRPKYKVIFNQCIVLLVSIFASSIADLFREGIYQLAKKGKSKNLKTEELKISVADLIEYSSEIERRLGQLIADKNDYSFQDMQSIGKAFKQYFEFSMEKDIDVHNIIFAQACRHVIVHDASKINERFTRQVSGASPRDIKPNVSGSAIEFTSEEVNQAAESMKIYFKKLRDGIENSLSS